MLREVLFARAFLIGSRFLSSCPFSSPRITRRAKRARGDRPRGWSGLRKPRDIRLSGNCKRSCRSEVRARRRPSDISDLGAPGVTSSRHRTGRDGRSTRGHCRCFSPPPPPPPAPIEHRENIVVKCVAASDDNARRAILHLVAIRESDIQWRFSVSTRRV